MSRESSPKLFGMDKWEVENAAETLTKAAEMENTKPKLHAVALKLIAKRQVAMGALLRAATSKRKT